MDEKVRTTLRMILAGVARAQSRVRCGKNLIAQMLCGSGSSRLAKLGFDRLSTFGLLKHLTQPDVAMLIDSLIATGHLEQVDLEPNRPVVQLTPLGTELMKAEGDVEVDVPIPADLLAKLRGQRPGTARPAKRGDAETQGRADAEKGDGAWGATAGSPGSAEEGADTEPDPAVLEALRRWCIATAMATGLPPHYVLTRATMEELARRRPQSREALLQVKGIGNAKLDRFGDALLAILAGQAPGGLEPVATAGSPGNADQTRGRGDAERGELDATAGSPGNVDGGPDAEPDPFDLANASLSEAGFAPLATPAGDSPLAPAATPAGQPREWFAESGFPSPQPSPEGRGSKMAAPEASQPAGPSGAATPPSAPPVIPPLARSATPAGDAPLAPAATPAGEEDRVRPNHFWTWRLVTSGFSAAECEVIRGIGREVVIDHLSRAIDEGWPVRPEVCFSPQLLASLGQVIGPGRPRQLRPLLAQLPEGTRYEEVELFLKCRDRT